MVDKVRNYLKQIYQTQPGDVIVIGVSGGADSVCLLCVLWQIFADTDVSLHVVHVNHNIREDALKDQQFVEALCHDWKIPFHCYSVQAGAYAKEHRISEEEAGRQLRYQAFEDTLRELVPPERENPEGIDRQVGRGLIAVAHTMEDNAETMLLNLFRGTGLKGLGGIPARRENIIRPLLCVRRNEIEAWLTAQQIGWCEDSTNQTDEYVRNRIRHKILPVAENEINDKAVLHMNQTAMQLTMAEDYLSKVVGQAWEDCIRELEDGYLLRAEKALLLHPYLRQRLMLELMERTMGTAKDIGRVHVTQLEELLRMPCGKQMHLAYGMTAVRTGEGILVRRYDPSTERNQEKRLENDPERLLKEGIPLNRDGLTKIEGYGSFSARLFEKRNFEEIPKETYTKWIDYDKIKNTVLLRTRRTGDNLTIDASGHTQKLKTYLVNEKIPAGERDRLLLLADGQHIIWIPGHRFSHAYYVTGQTKNILEIQYTKHG